MGGTKVLIVGIIAVAGTALAVSAIVALVAAVLGALISFGPPILMIVGGYAIARWLFRKAPKRIQERITASLQDPAIPD